MAAIGFPANAKTVTLPLGTTYAYVYFPQTDPSKSTILFLHGFPSSSYDWLYQIPYFAAKGYGIIAPDLLGYGGTDKPHSVEPYIFKTMAADIVALLDHEGIDKVHTVGHDFGSIFLSTIINYYPSRILSSTFLAVPYSPPGRMFDLDLAQQMTEKVIEFERFGYMRFFNEDDSWKLMNEHVRCIEL
jgi:soluble epoxide hydrolase/lipid-phosphate phosphatase